MSDCKNEYHKKYYDEHRDEILNQKKQYYLKNKNNLTVKNHNYYANNVDEILIQKKGYYLKHKDKILMKAKEYHIKVGEQRNERERLYYQKNKEKIMEHNRDYLKRPEVKARLEATRDIRNEKKRIYNKKYPEIPRKAKQKRRLKKAQLFESFTSEEWNSKAEATKGICPKCDKPYSEVYPYTVTMDHTPAIVNAPAGFVYTINDVEPMCGKCNLLKSDKF